MEICSDESYCLLVLWIRFLKITRAAENWQKQVGAFRSELRNRKWQNLARPGWKAVRLDRLKITRKSNPVGRFSTADHVSLTLADSGPWLTSRTRSSKTGVNTPFLQGIPFPSVRRRIYHDVLIAAPAALVQMLFDSPLFGSRR